MSASTAIGMVSASLRNLLVAEMQFPQVDVTILAPDETGSPRRINLFLYRIAENPYLRNQDFTVAAGVTNLFDTLYVGNFGGQLLNTSVPFVQLGAPRAVVGTLVVGFR